MSHEQPSGSLVRRCQPWGSPCQEFLMLPSPTHLWGVEAPARDWFVLREVLMTGSLALRMEERGLGIECLEVLGCG